MPVFADMRTRPRKRITRCCYCLKTGLYGENRVFTDEGHACCKTCRNLRQKTGLGHAQFLVRCLKRLENKVAIYNLYLDHLAKDNFAVEFHLCEHRNVPLPPP